MPKQESQFQPVPGVVYRILFVSGARFNFQYAPNEPEDPEPWAELDGSRRSLPDSARILAEVYNPHPKTRTLWGVSADGEDPDDDDITSDKREAKSWLKALREQYKGNQWRLVRSEHTEWAEVTGV